MHSITQLLTTPGRTLIDVRSPMEFASEQLPGSLNFPVDTISQHVDEIKKMNQPIIVYCRSGARSAMACQILKEAGLSGFHNGGSIYDLQFEIQQ
ncbi:MAG: hypothetical protein RLZZ543_21 [Bacteroidota bacterium]|jgi:phage shock protein E